jgi:hypothetical protein
MDHESATHTSAPTAHQRSNTAFLLIGLGLVILSVVLLVVSAWDSFQPASRILLTVLPVVLLYALGYRYRSHGVHQKSSQYALLAASLLFPFAIGTLIYQSGLYRPDDNQVNATLVFLISLVSVLWYAALEFFFRQTSHTPLTVLSTCLLALSLGSFLEQPPYMYYAFGIIVSYFFLSVGWTLQHIGKNDEGSTYTRAGLGIGLISLLVFPLAYFHTANDLPITLSYFAISVILLLVAILYSNEWTKEEHRPYFQVRSLAEQAGAITLTVPALLACLGSDVPGETALAFALGIVSILLSQKIRIKSLRYLGVLTVCIALLKGVLLSFVLIQASWIYFLLILGFAFVALAFRGSSTSVRYRSLLELLWVRPTTSLYGLGDSPSPDSIRVSSKGNGVFTVFFIIIGIYILLTLSLGSF